MACVSPFQILVNSNPVSVPCGWCLNCRVDKINALADRCFYELQKRLCGAFVTLTYTNEMLLTECPFYVDPETDEISPSLCYSHALKFIDRLRKRVQRMNSKNNISNNILAQSDFKYVLVGEYGKKGELFDRPHFHLLFFGLDFAYIKSMLSECWTYGFADSLPILNGGIRYVLKYMSKQEFGFNAKVMYDFKGLERPRCCHSIKLGTGLYFEDKDDIKSNYLTYSIGHGKRRPVPSYYKKQFFDFKDIALDWYTCRKKEIKDVMVTYNLKNYDTARARLMYSKTIDRYNKLFIQAQQNGESAPAYSLLDLYTPVKGYSLYDKPNRDKIRSLPVSTQRLLADTYIQSLCSEAEIPF